MALKRKSSEPSSVKNHDMLSVSHSSNSSKAISAKTSAAQLRVEENSKNIHNDGVCKVVKTFLDSGVRLVDFLLEILSNNVVYDSEQSGNDLLDRLDLSHLFDAIEASEAGRAKMEAILRDRALDLVLRQVDSEVKTLVAQGNDLENGLLLSHASVRSASSPARFLNRIVKQVRDTEQNAKEKLTGGLLPVDTDIKSSRGRDLVAIGEETATDGFHIETATEDKAGNVLCDRLPVELSRKGNFFERQAAKLLGARSSVETDHILSGIADGVTPASEQPENLSEETSDSDKSPTEFNGTLGGTESDRLGDNVRPFLCHVCLKRFQTRERFTGHLNIHTGATPYKCKQPGCQHRYTHRSSLSRHKKAHLKGDSTLSPLDNASFNGTAPSSNINTASLTNSDVHSVTAHASGREHVIRSTANTQSLLHNNSPTSPKGSEFQANEDTVETSSTTTNLRFAMLNTTSSLPPSPNRFNYLTAPYSYPSPFDSKMSGMGYLQTGRTGKFDYTQLAKLQ